VSLFGYLVFLIVLKWLLDYSDRTGAAPSLLLTFIGMFLHPTQLNSPDEQLYPGQVGVQITLLLVAMVAVPWMLLVKPLLMRRDHRRSIGLAHGHAEYAQVAANDEHIDASVANDQAAIPLRSLLHEEGVAYSVGEQAHVHEEFEFSEVFVHQIIHTIEFVLGAVSNTASYLRLWALSLAHSKLSTVFWEQIMIRCFELESAFAIFCGFSVWAALTVGVLLLMESLSAFLHALRLHWVEFMSKHYGGTGKAFEPFSFASIIAAAAENQ